MDEKPNRNESSRVNLRVVKPEGDKHYMVGLDVSTEDEGRAFNQSIAHHLKTFTSATVFQQVGDDGPGYLAWEIWDNDIDVPKLEELLLEIEEDAIKILELDDIDELYDKVYKKWDS